MTVGMADGVLVGGQLLYVPDLHLSMAIWPAVLPIVVALGSLLSWAIKGVIGDLAN
jgi:hypothetical protein